MAAQDRPDDITRRDAAQGWPRRRTIGVDGVLVSFADALSEPANRAALAFAKAVEGADWPGVAEVSTSLVSVFVRLDPEGTDHAALSARLGGLLAVRDWFAAPLPEGRRLWRVPAVFGTDLAPQLDETAARAGLSAEEAVRQICAAPLRVQAIGFAPGQPYLGQLPPAWDIPRQTALTPQVPAGAVVVALRQIVLFSVSTPTGWRHVGQTAVQLFRPGSDQPYVLRPGDEVLFQPAPRGAWDALRADGPDGGARCEVLP